MNLRGISRKLVTSLVAATAAIGVTATAWAAAGWCTFGTLRNVEVDSTASTSNGTQTYIIFTTPPVGGNGYAAPPTCSGTQYVAMGSPDHIKQLTALASQALLSGKPFQVHFKGDCVDANGTVVTSGGYARFDNASIGW